MERRVLIAVLLSFLVLYGYQAMFPPPPPPEPGAPTSQAASKTATAPNAAAPAAANPAPSVQGVAAELPPQQPARDVVVDNGDVRAVFTTRGAVIKSWQLKKYKDNSGRPYEVVAGHAPADAPLPLTIGTDDAALAAVLAAASYTVTSESTDASGWRAQFEYADAATGIRAEKSFSIATDKPYVVNVTAKVTRNNQPVATTLRWGPALGSGIAPSASYATYSPPVQPIFFKDGSVTRIAPDEIPAKAVHEGTFGFAGVDDHYFLVAAVKPKESIRIDYAPLAVPVSDVPAGAKYVSWAARFPSHSENTAFFAGPKDFDVLAAVDRDLVRAIDFGMFAWLVVPLLRALKWINVYVGNYGWSLILLTILINLAMFPLRHKSVVSMRKMQDVQPEVKAIQDRYSKLKMSDPGRAKMNQEMMALYKERGVNPASGCVPMLLTLPVLFAFYSMLSVAIELRGAPFVAQIQDLSAHDPWFIWPILMGATMFIQQKMTPSTADPMQQRIMLIMPIMMTGMFLWAASGLVIYWTVSNTWGIAQQMITNKLIGPAVVRTVRPPAERQMKPTKNVGAGKTDQAKER
jgi:YidC/Oxa1 family membrane protein insertase